MVEPDDDHLGINNKVCPVCGREINFFSSMCDSCHKTICDECGHVQHNECGEDITTFICDKCNGKLSSRNKCKRARDGIDNHAAMDARKLLKKNETYERKLTTIQTKLHTTSTALVEKHEELLEYKNRLRSQEETNTKLEKQVEKLMYRVDKLEEEKRAMRKIIKEIGKSYTTLYRINTKGLGLFESA